MLEDTLLTPMLESELVDNELTGPQLFLNFINQLEGWKTKCKNLHWAAPKHAIHMHLDAFLDIISDYQDGLAEGYMGILGKMQPNAVKGITCEALNAFDFIAEVKAKTIIFYNKIPKDAIYKGISSDCETLIQNINKYDYLFHLCDVKPY